MAEPNLTETLDAVFEGYLEPEARAIAQAEPRLSLATLATISGAISLKRIADALAIQNVDGGSAGPA